MNWPISAPASARLDSLIKVLSFPFLFALVYMYLQDVDNSNSKKRLWCCVDWSFVAQKFGRIICTFKSKLWKLITH